MNFVLVFVATYFIGSIPTAYLLVRYKAGIDIRKAGSGNVGAFNTFDVTKSKSIGIIVGLLDALKGFVVSAGLAWILRASFELQATGLVAVILGHNYPVWLKFHGGRGLATGAGALFAIGLMYTLVWCIIWAIVYGLKKNILAGNLIAIFVTPFVILAMPASWIERLMVGDCSAHSFQILAFLLSAILIASHLDAINEIRTKRRIGNE